jgi:hypothetical protein
MNFAQVGVGGRRGCAAECNNGEAEQCRRQATDYADDRCARGPADERIGGTFGRGARYLNDAGDELDRTYQHDRETANAMAMASHGLKLRCSGASRASRTAG